MRRRNYRVFLESANSGTDSYVQAQVDDDWASLTVADCGQRITLDFGVDSWRKTRARFERHRVRKLAKLTKLEKALGIMREYLETVEYKEEKANVG